MDAESSPQIAIIDERPIRAAILEKGLREAGFTGVAHIGRVCWRGPMRSIPTSL
jgi:response regulator NasT